MSVKNLDVLNIAGYKFEPLDDVEVLIPKFQAVCDDLELKGSVYLSPKGINFSLAGSKEAVKKYLNFLEQDRRFLDVQMNDLENRFHYRVVDVSSIKELANRWYPDIDRNIPSKAENHRALEDIIESIEELKYYREKLFI